MSQAEVRAAARTVAQGGVTATRRGRAWLRKQFSLVFQFTSASVFLPYRGEFSVCTCSCTVGKKKYHSV